MTEPSLPDPPADQTLAAEYALGMLEGAGRAAAARRRLADPAFASEVEAWEARLAGLADEIAPVPPPEGLWRLIAGQLATDVGDAAVVLRLKRSVIAWRAATAAALTAAACLACALLWPHTGPKAPVLTARLSASTKGPTIFVALYDPTRRAIVLTPATINATAGRSPELWLIPPGGKAVALGVATFDGSVQFVTSPGLQDVTRGALAVSLEPEGGSRTGQPTGPVIATGRLGLPPSGDPGGILVEHGL